MTKSLVVVESPSKAKTINKYLGKDFKVMASIGHIKDLPEKGLGVDPQKDFETTYQLIPDSKKKNNKKIVAELKAAAKDADAIYLAADPDREGEAICQHLAEELLSKRSKKPVHRVLFNEITRDAILDAFKHPRTIDTHKVNAQQARRVLDRLVGYQVSPLLCRKVGGRLSAGRVQSVALRLIAEREREILDFVPTEYWTVLANLNAQLPPSFNARLFKIDEKTLKTGDFENTKKSEIHIRDAETAQRIVDEIKQQPLIVKSVTTKEKRRNPVPPFITSKLQQEASRKLRFPVKKTMELAQRLYEGIELDDGEVVGLITYMRTDSTRVSDGALTEVRGYIEQFYGKEYLPAKANIYSNKKNVQDAHEAIRPTSINRTPEGMAKYLSKDELALYKLIWQRFVASQMNPALFDETIVEIAAGERYTLRATGLVLKFSGFVRVYEESKDEDEDNDEHDLPKLVQGEVLRLNSITPEQNFTKPPARYTEATLVKALEEKGIGRPSTYAQIISVIQARKYVEKQDGRFKPTDLGFVVNEVLVENFDSLFNVSYTARMEESLDDIEEGKLVWTDAIRDFYKKFVIDLETAEKNISKARAGLLTDEVCHKCGSQMVQKLGRFGKYLSCTNKECKATRDLDPSFSQEKPEESYSDDPCHECGKQMVLKKSRYGPFWACTGYPECKATRKVEAVANVPDIPTDEKCPKCGSQMVIKTGRMGAFTACSNYPKCKYIKQDTTGVICPETDCGGELLIKKSKRGRSFYGCSNYPKCQCVFWDKPVPEPCPKCGSKFLLEKVRKNGVQLKCPVQTCDYTT